MYHVRSEGFFSFTDHEGLGMSYGVDRRDVPAVAVPRLTLYLRKLRELEETKTEA